MSINKLYPRRLAAALAIVALSSGGLVAAATGSAGAAGAVSCNSTSGSKGTVSVKKAAFTNPPEVKKVKIKIKATLTGCTGVAGITGGKLTAKYARASNDCGFLTAQTPYTGTVKVKWTNAAKKKVTTTTRSGTFKALRLFGLLAFLNASSTESVGVIEAFPNQIPNACNSAGGLKTFTGKAVAGFNVS